MLLDTSPFLILWDRGTRCGRFGNSVSPVLMHGGVSGLTICIVSHEEIQFNLVPCFLVLHMLLVDNILTIKFKHNSTDT